jgi:hypothetical protein
MLDKSNNNADRGESVIFRIGASSLLNTQPVPQAHLDTATENGSGTLPKPAGEDACAT